MHTKIGKLLVAHPHFPNNSPFSKSVIYIYQDDLVNGTVGVVLNKCSTTSVSELCDSEGITFGDLSPAVHIGGPVNQGALALLHTDDWHSANTMAAGGHLRVSSDRHMLKKMSHFTNQPAYWRMFVGASIWRPGQLDAEIKGVAPYGPQSMWLTCDADEYTMFKYDGEKQWHKSLELCSQQTIDQYF